MVAHMGIVGILQFYSLTLDSVLTLFIQGRPDIYC